MGGRVQPRINFLDIATDELMLLDSGCRDYQRALGVKLLEGLSLGYHMPKDVTTMTLGRAAGRAPALTFARSTRIAAFA
jgi:hypothetical protein